MYTIRDLTPEDYDKVNELIGDPIYENLFSVKDISAAHIGGSYAAVAVTSGEGDVCAVLVAGLTPPCYEDMEPNQQAGMPQGPSFSEYTRENYGVDLPQLTTRFVRMAAGAAGHSAALSALLRAFFSAEPRHEVLCLQARPYAAIPDVLQGAFPELAPVQPLNIGFCTIRACPRAEVLRPLTVTVAQMKDHDDLVKIFEAQQTHLRERFGEFYLADIISQADPTRQLALVGNDFEANSTEITHPVSFLYAEKYDPMNAADDQCLRNLQATHQLEAFGLGSVPAVRLAFIRATASSPSAESRSGDLLAELFERWPDIDAVLVSVPSAASCGQMQLLKLFAPVPPRSCLSPREALFACHRDAWISGLQLEKLKSADDLIIIENNLKAALRLNGQNNFPGLDLEVFRPGKGGTLAAYASVRGQRVAVAIASVDLQVGTTGDQDVFGAYMQEYQERTFRRGAGRVISAVDVEADPDSKLFFLAARLTGGDASKSPFIKDHEFLKQQGLDPTPSPDSIWKPETCLQGRVWCHVHYGEQLEGCGYLKAFVVDPLFLQFRDDILDHFIALAGVEGLLLQVGEGLQKCVRRVYDADTEKFESSCGAGTPWDALTSFERSLFRQADRITEISVQFNLERRFYDGRLGQHHGADAAAPPDPHRSCDGAMYGPSSKLHLDRQKDELLFNQKQEQDELQDIALAAIRALKPHFSLFKITKTAQIRVFRPPTKLAGDPTVEYVVKPPSLLTDRLVVLGSGPGLLAGLEALQDCHPLARFQSITVIHPPPGPIFRFNFDDEVGQQQLFDHGANLPQRRKRAANMFYDVFIGDVYEVNVGAGTLKVAFGSEVLFDLLLICPDGSDSESLRQVPFYNLNSSVSFPYGATDPCGLEAKQNILTQKSQLSELNTRGFEEEAIAQVLGDGRLHCRLIQSLYQQMQVEQRAELEGENDSMAASGPSQAPQRFKQHQSSAVDVSLLLKSRLHARTFFRYLQRVDLGSGPSLSEVLPGSLVTRRQLAALACATMTFNLEFCVSQLYSPGLLKQLKQKELQQRGDKKDEKAEDGVPGQKAAAGGQGESDVATQQANGYRFLSPGAKSSQIIQIYNPQVQAELPLIINSLSTAMMKARKELFPELYPTVQGSGDAAKPIKTCSAVDVARTTICVYGDTFEAFAIIQAFLDRGVAPDSLVLLLPQDPNADVDPVDQKQNEEIEYLMAGPGAVRVAPRPNCHVPEGFGGLGGLGNGSSAEPRMESKSTTQTAEKRAENYPAELHKNLLQTLRLNGVNIKENVKIIDLYASITNAKKSGGGGDGGEDGGSDDDDDEEESEPETSSGSGAPEDDEEFDETVEIDQLTLKNAAETLTQLDELDICLTKKPGSFGGDLEDLNPILDQILLGRADQVLKQQLGKDDADFAVSDLPADQREAEIVRLVKQQLLRLAKRFKSTSGKKRRYRKKALNGSALNGIRLQLLKAEEEDAGGGLRSNIPDSAAHPRTFQSPAGSVRVLLNAADNAAQVPNQIDIQCCALFLTEPFGVPNNVSSALMRSDLVFDKALIVDPSGSASDPRVYASGNVAKINRQTLLEQLQLLGGSVGPDGISGRPKRSGIPSAPLLLTADPGRPVVTWSLYDAAETGAWAAYRLVAGRLGAEAERGRVPEFAKPLCLAARVPGGHVFRAARPLRDLRDPRLSVARLFRTVKTGDLVAVGQGGRYCALDVDPLGLVDSMVVYSRDPLSEGLREIILAVIGLPVVLFNQLEQRWQREEVPDLLDFLCTYGPQMILSNPEMSERVNEMVVDVVNSPEFKAAWGEGVSAEQVRGIADVPPEAMSTKAGTDAVKAAGFASKLTRAARDLAREVEERFPELCRGTGSRGRVMFE